MGAVKTPTTQPKAALATMGSEHPLMDDCHTENKRQELLGTMVPSAIPVYQDGVAPSLFMPMCCMVASEETVEKILGEGAQLYLPTDLFLQPSAKIT